PRGAASLGFLAGNRFTCPETGTAYVVIESAIQLPWSISGDHLGPALSQGWTVVQEEVRKNDGQLVGWYHTHHGVDPTPSPADIEAHTALFAEPWHIALVVTPGDAPVGGFFQIASAALGVVAGAVLFNVYHALASGRGPVKAGPHVAAPSPRERVDRMADTVALAVGAFDLRARLFDGHKMACPDLAHGLVDLEERWTS